MAGAHGEHGRGSSGEVGAGNEETCSAEPEGSANGEECTTVFKRLRRETRAAPVAKGHTACYSERLTIASRLVTLPLAD